jgi:hypothetical protein
LRLLVFLILFPPLPGTPDVFCGVAVGLEFENNEKGLYEDNVSNIPLPVA